MSAEPEPIPHALLPVRRRDKIMGVAIGLGVAVVLLLGLFFYDHFVLRPEAMP